MTEGPQDVARRISRDYVCEAGPLMPTLHGIQQEIGFIPAAAITVVADELNLSRAEVHGVVTFYRDFRQDAPGRTVVRVCRGEACQANGSETLVEELAGWAQVRPGQTAADGSVTLDDVFCLGNCALGPSVQVGHQLIGRATVARVDQFVRACL